jgi:hypothetical protein
MDSFSASRIKGPFAGFWFPANGEISAIAGDPGTLPITGNIGSP